MIQKLTALILITLLIAGTIAGNVSAEELYTRTADPSTLDSWQELFSTDINNTSNAGHVWTDKTVLTNDAAFSNVSTSQAKRKLNMTDADNNFLVALSTMASSKSIVGHDTLPTDTVFVLDLSSSMYSGSDFIPDTIQQMVAAVNNAMDTLLRLNNYNRVGVLLYYGNQSLVSSSTTASHYTALLPLDRYLPLSSKNYLLVGLVNTQLDNITVNKNLKNEKGAAPVSMPHANIRDKGVAGTYIQLGIKKAVDWLMAADPTIPSNADFQAGATRIPIMVLMSDGEPTAADTAFHNPGTSQMGSNTIGERSPAETDFLTQLTAGLAREMMDRHYVETTPLFYSLSLGTSISLDVMDPENNDTLYNSASSAGYTVKTGRAHSSFVSDTPNTLPQYQNADSVVNRKIQEYWNRILAGETFNMTVLDNTSSWDYTHFYTKTVQGISQQNVIVDGKSFTFPTSLSQKYYVDHHFVAEDADDLDDAFSRLVQEIRLQSSYYPTYVESNMAELDGYVTFLDEIGPNMEVKKVHGLVYGNMYYSGASYAYYISEMAKSDGTAVFGSFDAPTEYGWLVIDAIASRLNLTRDTARNVLRKSVEKNHVYYNANGASNGDYSNAFIWYADADANYVEVEHGQTPPQNARYLVTSYSFLDSTANANPDPSTLNAPLLYCSIRVAEDLTTGKQIVDWQVPAALIPTVNYEVTLSGNSLENPGEITVEYKPDSPLRAIYEVGLRSDLTPWNAQSILGDQNRNPDGSYTFYTNDWNADTVGKPVSNTLRDQVNTIAYFQPSYQNERYLYAEDMPLYVKQGSEYVPYTGSQPAANDGNTYYVRHSRFQWDWSNGKPVNAAINFHYHDASASLDAVKGSSALWYIPADTMHPFFTGDQYTPKSSNPTETIEHLYYTATELFDGEPTNHAVVNLGNNGKLSFIPSTGIALTKQVDAVPPGTTPVFTFTVENASVPNGNYPIVYTDKDMNQLSGAAYPSAISFTNGEATVQLRRNETIYLTGLPQGIYTITEQLDSLSNFNVGSVLVNGETVIDLYAVAVQVVSNHLTNVQYNNKLDTTGDVVIRKTVTHPFGDSYVLPEGLTFTFDIDLGTGYANKLITLQREAGDTGAPAVRADANGILQDVTIMPGKPVMIPKLEPNTTVIVTEVNTPPGFSATPVQDEQQTPEYGGVIVFSFNNVYQPEPAPVNITLTGTKTLTGREWQPGDVFTFKLQKREGPDRWTDLGTKTVRFEDTAKTFDFTNEMRAFSFTAAGVYTFRVIEVPGMLPGITYDPTSCYFDVTVADSDMDGKLEISKVESGVNISLSSGKTGADNDHVLNAHFTNQFTKADISLRKAMNDNSGQNLPVSGYTFGLYRDIDCKQLIASATTVEDGTAAFETDELLYTIADLEGAQTRTFTYYVKEIVPDPPRYGMTYDASLRRVNVALNRNGEKLTVSVAPGNALLFTNSYDPDDAFVFLAGHKYFPGGALFDKAFRFDLYLADEQYTPTLLLSSAYCAADGAYRFDPLQFTQTGTYRFTVQEDRSQKEPYVEYDESVYRIQVVVTDENGVLTPAVTVQHDLNGKISLVTDPAKLDFTNAYQPPLTGDSANLGRWFMLMMLSAAGLLMLLRRRNA